MHVRLLGTGAADGWPDPWCSCASCSDARDRGRSRRQTSVLVDGAVLLDLSPALPPAGVSLAGVRTVLVTHAHPDHCAPAALLWRHWVLPDERLTVAGPADVLEQCRPWLAPGAPIDLVEAVPGRTLRCDRYEVRVLPADHEVPTVLYDLTGPDGARLLYATDTGPLREAAVEAVAGGRSTSSCWRRPSATGSTTAPATSTWPPSPCSSTGCGRSARSPGAPTSSPCTWDTTTRRRRSLPRGWRRTAPGCWTTARSCTCPHASRGPDRGGRAARPRQA